MGEYVNDRLDRIEQDLASCHAACDRIELLLAELAALTDVAAA